MFSNERVYWYEGLCGPPNSVEYPRYGTIQALKAGRKQQRELDEEFSVSRGCRVSLFDSLVGNWVVGLETGLFGCLVVNWGLWLKTGVSVVCSTDTLSLLPLLPLPPSPLSSPHV